nr:class IV adenylate cyclase [Candidatus Sigynarchaeota archaeon]
MAKKNEKHGENALEIEIKVKILSIEAMASALEKLGAKFDCDLVHEDYYFDKPEKAGSFARTDEALRLRVSRDLTKHIERHFLTYKGPKVDATTKTRVEIDVGVDDGQKVRAILKAAGFKELIALIKERKSYHFEDISIMLDKVQHLDDPYMEVEIVAENPAMLDATREKLFAFLQKLGIGRDASERKSYLELVAARLTTSRKS